MTTKTLAIALASVVLLNSVAMANEQSDAHRIGCWETLVQAVRKTSSPDLRDMDVQLPGAGAVHVRYNMAEGRSGVVLIMCGTFAKAENPYSDDLARGLIHAGFNVVTMDSFMSTRFVGQARIGAPGNLRHEALVAGQLLEEFTKRTNSTASELSVVGVSYGGGVALQMAQLEKENKLPVKLARVLALSVPVSFREAMRTLDEYENLPYSYDKIVPIVNSAKPDTSAPSKTRTEELEKVLGRGFRLDLSNTVNLVDRMYAGQINPNPGKVLGLESLGNPRAQKMEREVEAGAISFQPFFECWVAPYWVGKKELASPDELLDPGEMSRVLPGLGANVELVIASNDPLNRAGAAEELQQIKTEAKVTILPTGGHAGFVRTAAMQSILNRVFGPSMAEGPRGTERTR